MRILGIDGGLNGGLVLLIDGKVSASAVMPTINAKKGKREYDTSALMRHFQTIKPDHVFLEKAQAMPGQGVSSMFSIGLGHGLIRGMLAALRLPHTLVHPRTWQAVMFRDISKRDTKTASVLIATRLWPGVDWRASEHCKVAHDGLTDASLIAEFGRRQIEIGGQPGVVTEILDDPQKSTLRPPINLQA